LGNWRLKMLPEGFLRVIPMWAKCFGPAAWRWTWAPARRAIDTGLTPKQREAIQAELGGAPPEEIATRLGTNRNALYKLDYDARVRLKQAILAAGWSEAHVRLTLGGG